ncbi:hypothetical protein HYX19_03910 [Candidatus Woesearchaeota archaeon]|nr:hypothetical protein [Candidatus Woesearchaeota archaeon]
MEEKEGLNKEEPMQKGYHRKLLRLSEISLWLDNYDDIFSDFDPRPISQRALSDDFLREAKKASRENVSGAIDLTLLIPTNERNPHQEEVIKRRLKQHLNKHFNLLSKEKKWTVKKGLLFTLFGILLMFIATYIIVEYEEKGLLFNFLIVLIEPGGWFLFWEGLDMMLFEQKKINPELEFYKKASKGEISFSSY